MHILYGRRQDSGTERTSNREQMDSWIDILLATSKPPELNSYCGSTVVDYRNIFLTLVPTVNPTQGRFDDVSSYQRNLSLIKLAATKESCNVGE